MGRAHALRLWAAITRTRVPRSLLQLPVSCLESKAHAAETCHSHGHHFATRR